MRGCAAVLILLVLAPTAAAAASGRVAALQAALYARGLYAGSVDGVPGPATTRAVRRLQRRAGLTPDGIAGPRTRRVLGRAGRHPYGSRTITPGDVGYDVAALQFELERHGFPLGGVDGGFGPRSVAALSRLQARSGLPVVGVAGPATRRVLRGPPPRAPLRLAWPIAARVGDRYGPRGNGWHAGWTSPRPPARRCVPPRAVGSSSRATTTASG